MPNNRNRNKNKNRNKRNKNQNNNNNKQQQQQKEQTKAEAEEQPQQQEVAAAPEPEAVATTTTTKEAQYEISGSISNEPATCDQIVAGQADASVVAVANHSDKDNDNEAQAQSVTDNESSEKCQEQATQAQQSSAEFESAATMGTKNSKPQKQLAPEQTTAVPTEQLSTPTTPTTPPQLPQAKVIVHRIVTESDVKQAAAEPPKCNTKVIIHQIRLETDEEASLRKAKLKPTIEEINTAPANASGSLSPTPRYLVESPKTPNLELARFSRGLQIQELNSDYSSGEFNLESPLVSEVDSENEPTTPTPEQSGNNRQQQEELRLKRAQKRNALESHFLPQLLSPRYLDSILEENSDAGSEYALSRSSSAANNEERAQEAAARLAKANESFPKSQLDFKRRHRRGTSREEPVALMLETKLLEQPAAEEACTRLESTLSPQSEDAELVYLSSSGSSSLSDLMELELEQAAALAERALVDLDTDASALITKPAAASLASDDDDQLTCTTTEPATSSNDTETEGEVETEVETETESRESTPVNQASSLTSGSLSSLYATAPSAQTTPTPTATPTLTPTPTSTANDVSKLEMPRELNESTPTPLSTPNTLNNTDAISTLLASLDSSAAPYGEPAETATATVTETVKRDKYVRRTETETETETTSHTTFETVNKRAAVMDKMRELVETSRQGNVDIADTTNQVPPPVPPPPVPRRHYTQPETNTQATTLSPTPLSSLNALILKRQESNDSHCSDSTQHSQCTAIHMASPPPPFSPTSPPTPPPRYPHNNGAEPTQSHSEPMTFNFSDAEADTDSDSSAIKKLRLLCTEQLASMPYGEDVLEELANVAQNIGEVRVVQQQAQQSGATSPKMPYPLPDLPHIGELQLSLQQQACAVPAHTVAITQQLRASTPPPPPVPAPPSSYDSWLGVPTHADPKLLVCLSPKQRELLQQQQQQKEQQPTNADGLLDAHQKFVERRGYHELSAEQVRAINNEKLEQEQQILETAAFMRQLRKSLTPTPPPVPPPPVPVKSSETAAKAKNNVNALNMRGTGAVSAADDVSVRNANTTTAATTTTTPTTATPFAEPPKQTQQQQQEPNRLYEFLQRTDNINGIGSSVANGMTASAPSSNENNSRRTADGAAGVVGAANDTTTAERQSHSHSHSQSKSSNSSYMSSKEKFPDATSGSAKMQSMENELARMFPSIAKQGDIFEAERKRFSNIEQSAAPNWTTQQPKRYSNIETSSYESKKRTENGQVIYDYTNSSREKQEQGAKPEAARDQPKVLHIPVNRETDVVDCAPKIMSALNLNSASTPTAAPTATEIKTKLSSSTFIDDSTAESSVYKNSRNESESAPPPTAATASAFKTDISNTYEEFRQRAKAAVEALGTPAAPPAPAAEAATTSTSNAKPSQGNHFDHEKLFKDFDALSQQLHAELQSGKAQREQREKSTSLYDLSRLNSSSKQQLEQLKQQRHEHMQELEREIERSARSRQDRMSMPRSPTTPTTPTITHEIPVQLEADYEQHRRRAESMCNLPEPRPHTSAGHYYYPPQDDWAQYANDLGYSENIARPFAKEVEICYQRQQQRQPHTIRAPRLSASTNDLSYSSGQHNFDTNHAYAGRRTHAPMLSQAPQQQRPHYASCYSMIELNPNPTYISTTSRRGVSPAPQPPLQPARDLGAPPEYDRQRRASLPRELHEQQLKYISSKEEALKMEFERLQNERHRLMEEMQRAPVLPPPQRRESFRPAAKLPTLTEDEVFRQQMAEEWLNKVAEREERRLHKIIKISKLQEDEHEHSMPNISDEFLNRVKERRHKLSMPADSDWESGAESQPYAQAQASESDAEVAPVRVIEGKSEANLRQLPRHLREFAKFSNQEQIEGGQRLVQEEEERREDATDNSQSSATKKSTIVKTYKVSRLPPSVQQADESFNSNFKNSEVETTETETETENEHETETDNDSSTTSTSATASTTKRIIRNSGASNKTQSYLHQTPPPPTTTTSTSNQNSNINSPDWPFASKMSPNFDELFAGSPFRSKIFEEFDKYWRNFEHTSNTF